MDGERETRSCRFRPLIIGRTRDLCQVVPPLGAALACSCSPSGWPYTPRLTCAVRTRPAEMQRKPVRSTANLRNMTERSPMLCLARSPTGTLPVYEISFLPAELQRCAPRGDSMMRSSTKTPRQRVRSS